MFDAPPFSRESGGRLPADAVREPVPGNPELKAHFMRMRQLRPGLHLHADDAHDAQDMTAEGSMSEGLRVVLLLEGAVDVSYGARRMRLTARNASASALLVSVAEPDLFIRRARQGSYARRVSLGLGYPWLEQAAGGDASPALDAFMRNHLAMQQWTVSPRITAIAEQIVRPPEFEPLMQNLYLESRVLELVSEALSSISSAASGAVNQVAAQVTLRPQEHRRIRELHDYLSTSDDDELSLEQLARRACTNPNTLQKQFRALYGMTVFEFVRDNRLQRARQALERDGVTVGQAAACAGYSSAANFATAYKRRFGIAPKLSRSRF